MCRPVGYAREACAVVACASINIKIGRFFCIIIKYTEHRFYMRGIRSSHIKSINVSRVSIYVRMATTELVELVSQCEEGPLSHQSSGHRTSQVLSGEGSKEEQSGPFFLPHYVTQKVGR